MHLSKDLINSTNKLDTIDQPNIQIIMIIYKDLLFQDLSLIIVTLYSIDIKSLKKLNFQSKSKNFKILLLM